MALLVLPMKALKAIVVLISSLRYLQKDCVLANRTWIILPIVNMIEQIKLTLMENENRVDVMFITETFFQSSTCDSFFWF